VKELFRGFHIAPIVHQDIQDSVVLIDGPPQVMAFAVNGQKHFLQISFASVAGSTATQLSGMVLPELLTPLADGFIGHADAAFEHEFLHVAVAQVKAIIEPKPVADDFARKTVVFVALGVCGRGHVWLPISGVTSVTNGASPR
jgi:hypothetical protein